ncbi:cyanophycinase [candidate division KSB1 bacterium]|nr:cyanophycinase [candidate division KSB1 bacterium]
MKSKMLILISLLFLLGCQQDELSNNSNGYLFIVGGGGKPSAAIEKFIDLCGNEFILIITSASGYPRESGPAAVELFKDHGADNVDWLHIASPDSANSDDVVEAIRRARGIFFTGGVQGRLMHRLRGTRAEKEILALYFEKKGVIGGTSAGAAVQSELMITGDGDFTILEKNNIVTEPGFGFLKNCIIDQHFVARRRNNRLLSLVIEKKLPGIGIDESTAIIYHPDDMFDVYGQGSVVIYDPRKASIPVEPEVRKLSAEHLRLSVLHEGQSFDMTSGKIIIREK